MDGERPEVSEFGSVDPAPASDGNIVSNLRNTICDEDEKMFQRMRALFALRNIGGEESGAFSPLGARARAGPVGSQQS